MIVKSLCILCVHFLTEYQNLEFLCNGKVKQQNNR